MNNLIKLKKISAGRYESLKVIDGIEYRVVAELLDDYKSFSYEYTRYSDNKSFSDGWYGLRLKDIKNQNWDEVVDTLNDKWC